MIKVAYVTELFTRVVLFGIGRREKGGTAATCNFQSCRELRERGIDGGNGGRGPVWIHVVSWS
jgi:hypothetical protein